MILLDTHVWAWWVNRTESLSKNHRQFLEKTTDDLCISMISVWEVSMLESKGRIKLPLNIEQWLDLAINESGIKVIDLTRSILTTSNQLLEPFHRDPADRIIVSTSRLLNIPLLTSDAKILKYPHVLLAKV